MLVELKSNLQSIYDQVMAYLSPNNLRRNINLLGVEGRIRQGNSFNLTSVTAITDVSVEAVSGATYGFSLNSSGYYESTNQGVQSTYSICKLKFTAHGQTELILDCINFAESNYDYGVLSNLDTELTATINDSENVYHSFKGKQSASVQQVIYEVPAGEHFIHIKYRKDSSADSDNDSLQFKVGTIGTVTTVGDEVVASAYFTKEALLADTTQPDNTVGIVMPTPELITEIYQKIDGTWQFLANFSNRVRTFATVDEMMQHTDLPENTFAIVYGTTYVGTYRLDNGAWTQIGDSTEEQIIMDSLNEITGTTDEYEGTGGTDEEISTVLDEVIGGNE